VLPAWARGALIASPAQLGVVAVVLLIGLGVTGWLLWGGRVVEQAPAAAEGRGAVEFSSADETPVPPVGGGSPSTAVSGAGAAAPGATVETTEAGELVTVDVAGKVRRPGIVQLPVGSRVADAIEAAGGVRRRVDLTPINLARVLVDGEQILVGIDPPPGGVPAIGPAPPGPGALVNLNTADQVTLETLPGVGPVTAGAIINWRTAHGGFSAVEELVEVDGIGEATLAKLAPLVTV
jgi:competence protein ComEA